MLPPETRTAAERIGGGGPVGPPPVGPSVRGRGPWPRADGSKVTNAFAVLFSEEAAAEFQAALRDMAGGAGMAATVMSADGAWSGATEKAD
jgi:hypothetical protein